jgi:hypothetical protein
MGEEWEINYFKKFMLSLKAAKNSFIRTWKMWNKQENDSS